MILRHEFCNRTLRIGLETNIAVGENSNQLAIFSNRDTGDMEVLHSSQSFT